LVGDAPVLTEVVTPKKVPIKNIAQKPVIATPVLTEVVIPKAKPSLAAAINVVPAVAHVVPAMAPKKPAPIATPAPVVTAPAVPPPVAAAPVAATPAPPTPLPVIPQSQVMPRKGIAAKVPAKFLPNKLKSLQHVVVATAPVPVPRAVKKLDEPLPDLESTQTVRALTPKELEEHDRWFVIQLALADHAFDPEAVPNLDIFSEYRLYSVAGMDQGRVVHALRLGFFKEEIGAVAVASYLAAYWDKPTIKRVSVAERERFVDQRVEARKDIGATGRHSVIEITDELVARRRRATKAPSPNNTPNRSAEY
jgi:hypothetical protein